VISVVIPARDEESSIGAIIQRVKESLVGYPHEIIVVNDYSKDRTEEITKKALGNFLNIHLVKTDSPGVGEALKIGFEKTQGETIVVVMADLSDDTFSIPLMYKKLKEGYDVVCASRYIWGGKRIGCPLWKLFISQSVNAFVRLFTGIPTWDATNGFKMYSKKVVESIHIESRGFEVFLEIPLKAYFMGYRISEIPTIWLSRKKGKSKFRLPPSILPYMKWVVWGLSMRFSLFRK